MASKGQKFNSYIFDIKEIFDTLTKDKTDIFANPNQLKDMAGMGDSEDKPETKEMPMIW